MLDVDSISKSFARRLGRGRKGAPQLVLDNVSLHAEPGQIVTIVGASGCGKSTLLNCIAGLITADSGQVNAFGSLIDGPSAHSAVVFQQSSLLPWRTVERNVAYGIEFGNRRLAATQRREMVERVLTTVGLSGEAGHYPHELSGGMQQRANLARALATDPRLLLMDEPFGALDALTKEVLQDELADLVSVGDRITVFITHDIEEAIFLGDQVVVMEAHPGRISRILEPPFPRPRARSITADPQFQELVASVREVLVSPLHQSRSAARV